ncbi:MAG: RNA polymerase sigma factor [bacterium]|nr:RNA polymerase sigma factor [bacterium]
MSGEKNRNKIAEFFKNEHQRMVGFVRRLIDDTAERDGEDIVQDVLVNIFDAADVTLPIENLSAYVYSSLRNRIVDLYKKKDTQKEAISLDRGLPNGSGSRDLSLANILHDIRYDTASDFEKKEIRNSLYDALDSLGEEDRAIIIKTEFEGRPFREISEEWDVPLGTLLSRKSRALEKIRKMLADTI